MNNVFFFFSKMEKKYASITTIEHKNESKVIAWVIEHSAHNVWSILFIFQFQTNFILLHTYIPYTYTVSSHDYFMLFTITFVFHSFCSFNLFKCETVWKLPPIYISISGRRCNSSFDIIKIIKKKKMISRQKILTK